VALPRALRTPAVGLLVAAVAACGPAPADGVDAGDSIAGGPGFPSFYIDREVRMLVEGRNQTLDGYLERVRNCREAGLPVQEIPEHELALVGTGRWQLWRGRDHVATRVEDWTYGQPPMVSRESMCTFFLAHAGSHAYVDATRHVAVDLATGEVTTGDGNPDLALVHTGGVDDAGQVDQIRKLGGTGPMRRTVAGQPCDEWRSASGASQCIWTGLVPWGIGTAVHGPFDALAGVSDVVIALAAEPPEGGSGAQVVTRGFTVGQAFDRDAMMPDVGGASAAD
jgi:hypothetical protein